MQTIKMHFSIDPMHRAKLHIRPLACDFPCRQAALTAFVLSQDLREESPIRKQLAGEPETIEPPILLRELGLVVGQDFFHLG